MSLFRRRYTHRGAPPGTVVQHEEQVEPRISYLAYTHEEFSEGPCESLADLPAPVEGGVAWIDVRGLGDGSIVQELATQLELHPLAASDVVNVGQRPKVELYGDTLFIVIRMVTLNEEEDLRWEQVSLFLREGLVLTFQETHEDCLEPLRDRIRAGRKTIRNGGADYLACMVLDAVVDGYFPILEHYGDVLEELERAIFGQRSRTGLADLYAVKRDLAGFRRATWPLREALSHMLRTDEYELDEGARLHLRDALDHVMQVVEVNESYRELATSLVDVHISMIGHRTNEVMRVLTVVSAIFIPLTFVAGIYGMNFDTSQPLNLPELGWPYGYLFFWGVSGMIVIGLLALFTRLGWLRR